MFQGFGIYYLGGDQVKQINFDIISDQTEKNDAFAAVRGFRLLRQQDFFKEIDKNKYHVWFDCGKHFRNQQMAGYLFQELRQEEIQGN